MIIDKVALETIILSSIEAYPLETVGFLLGLRKGLDYLCKVAYPIQRAERKLKSVKFSRKIHELMKKASEKVVGYRILGIYHSHPDELPIPSVKDIMNFMFSEYMVSLIISISKTTPSTLKWHAKENVIIGSIAGYRIILSSHVKVGSELVQASIRSPLIDVLNLLASLGLDYSLLCERLSPEDYERLQYHLNKIIYLTKRGRTYHSKKISYHRKAIKEIAKQYEIL